MEIDQETQKAIDDYVESINDKEEELLNFKSRVTYILSEAEKGLEEMIEKLDKDFNDNKIDDNIYLDKIKEHKNKILENTKESLESLLKNLV